MPVSNDNNFSLQEVVNEINPTTDDLQDCINDATLSFYDPQYFSSPATSLLEFRNYQDPGSSSPTTPYLTNTTTSYKWYRAVDVNGNVSGNEGDYDSPGANDAKRKWVLHNPTNSSIDIRLRLDDDQSHGFKGNANTNQANIFVTLDNGAGSSFINDVLDVSSGSITLSANSSFNITFTALDRIISSSFSVYFEYHDGGTWQTLTKSTLAQ